MEGWIQQIHSSYKEEEKKISEERLRIFKHHKPVKASEYVLPGKMCLTKGKEIQFIIYLEAPLISQVLLWRLLLEMLQRLLFQLIYDNNSYNNANQLLLTRQPLHGLSQGQNLHIIAKVERREKENKSRATI